MHFAIMISKVLHCKYYNTRASASEKGYIFMYEKSVISSTRNHQSSHYTVADPGGGGGRNRRTPP